MAKAKLERAGDERSLIAVITEGVPGTEMAPARLTAPEIKLVAAWVRKLGQTASQASSGNGSRGEQIYLGKGNCGGRDFRLTDAEGRVVKEILA